MGGQPATVAIAPRAGPGRGTREPSGPTASTVRGPSESSRPMPGEAPVGTAGDRGSLLLSQAKHRRDRRGNAAVRRIRLQDAATDPVDAAPMHRTGRADRRILRMNFPSTEFDDAVTAACQGTGSEADVALRHATLR